MKARKNATIVEKNIYIFSGGLTMIRNNRDVNRLETGLNRIQESINRFSGNYFNQKIIDLWERMKRNEGKEKLKTMPIDVISTLVKDTPINQLVNNGFRTIYDIENQERSEEHTSELQSRGHLVCRLLLETKNTRERVAGVC